MGIELKRRYIRRLASWCTFLMCGCAVSAGDDGDEVLCFSFFRGNGQAGIFLAAGEDGLKFTPLNDDRPVMMPAPWEGQNLTRDPSMAFHGGKFHAVWTTGWKGNCFGYAESADLVHWDPPVRVEPFPANTPQPGNLWAPEICWDPVRGAFLIVWSSGGRLYHTRTRDGKTFTPAEAFFDQKFRCIDGMLVMDERSGGKNWVMIYKNEEPEAKGGKNLLVATAPADFSKAWTMEGAPIIGPGTLVRPQSMAEGPSLLKRGDGWFLYWDSPLSKTYAMAGSPDLKTWTDRTAELRLPGHPRHGTVFRAPRAAVGWFHATPGTRLTADGEPAH